MLNFLSSGIFFCYSNPVALQDQIIKDMGMDEATFMQLYSWYVLYVSHYKHLRCVLNIGQASHKFCMTICIWLI